MKIKTQNLKLIFHQKTPNPNPSLKKPQIALKGNSFSMQAILGKYILQEILN